MIKYNKNKTLSFKLIKKSDLFENSGGHLISEDFVRMCTVRLEKDYQTKWQHKDWDNSFEILIIILNGIGKFITSHNTVPFKAGDQFYLINAPCRISHFGEKREWKRHNLRVYLHILS